MEEKLKQLEETSKKLCEAMHEMEKEEKKEMEQRINELKHVFEKYELPINNDIYQNEPLIHSLYDLFMYDIIEDDNNDNKYLDFVGTYSTYIKINYELAEKYYLKAIEMGNESAIYNLGRLYKILKRYDKMEEYYNKILDKETAYELGKYYSKTSLEKSLKYYTIAAEKGNNNACQKLGMFYFQSKQYDLMDKYYMLSFECGDKDVLYQLISNYMHIKNNEKLLKYLKLSLNNNDYKSLISSILYFNNINKYEPELESYILTFIKNNTNDYGLKEIVTYLIKYKKLFDVFSFDNNEENKSIIKKIIKYVKYTDAVTLCEKYDIKMNTLIGQFMKNKYNFSKQDDCTICFDNTKLIPFDCFGHYYCEKCYCNMDKCPTCFIPRNPIMNNLL